MPLAQQRAALAVCPPPAACAREQASRKHDRCKLKITDCAVVTLTMPIQRELLLFEFIILQLHAISIELAIELADPELRTSGADEKCWKMSAKENTRTTHEQYAEPCCDG